MKANNLKEKIISILMAFGFAVAVSILLYPTFMEAVNNISQTYEIGSYESSQEELGDSELQEIREKAIAYNQRLYEEQKKKSYSYQGADATDAEYESQMVVSKDVDTIAYLEIPKIKLYLPIVHGTKDDSLEYEIGHIYGTSLPVSGVNTHSVLAGHTGLRKADLFDHLTDMKVGDEFFIHTLGKKHNYRVCEIHVVLPEEENPYLQIEEGKDLITLYTCTPYGVNDHRLLVRGEHIGDEEELGSDSSTKTIRKNRVAMAKAAGLACIPLAILLIGIIRAFAGARRYKRTQKQEGEKP